MLASSFLNGGYTVLFFILPCWLLGGRRAEHGGHDHHEAIILRTTIAKLQKAGEETVPSAVKSRLVCLSFALYKRRVDF